MIYGVTGHRPPKLGGYNEETTKRLGELAKLVVQSRQNATKWVTGMAQGWDLAIAEACVELEVPFHAALAHPKQDSIWPVNQQERFRSVLSHAGDIVIVSDEPSKASYIVRDHWIVRNCDQLVALWNGDTFGGTWATVRSAQALQRELVNVWPQWVSMQPKSLWGRGFD